MDDQPKFPDTDLARALREQLATVTGGLAPDVYVNAWWDWYLNVSRQPSKQLEIMQDALTKTLDSWSFALKAGAGEPVRPAEGDLRFKDGATGRSGLTTYSRTAIVTTRIGGKRPGPAYPA